MSDKLVYFDSQKCNEILLVNHGNLNLIDTFYFCVLECKFLTTLVTDQSPPQGSSILMKLIKTDPVRSILKNF